MKTRQNFALGTINQNMATILDLICHHLISEHAVIGFKDAAGRYSTLYQIILRRGKGIDRVKINGGPYEL